MAFYPSGLVFDVPAVNLCINREYIPFITGALEALTIDAYWPDQAVTGIDFPYEIQRLQRRLDSTNAGYECNPDTGEPTEEFEHTFDFSIDDQGWDAVLTGGGSATATYSAGLGWVSLYNVEGGGNTQLRIQLPTTYNRQWRSIEIQWENNLTPGSFDVAFFLYTAPLHSSGVHDDVVLTNFTGANNWRLDININGASCTFAIYKLIIRGVGSDPF